MKKISTRFILALYLFSSLLIAYRQQVVDAAVPARIINHTPNCPRCVTDKTPMVGHGGAPDGTARRIIGSKSIRACIDRVMAYSARLPEVLRQALNGSSDLQPGAISMWNDPAPGQIEVGSYWLKYNHNPKIIGQRPDIIIKQAPPGMLKKNECAVTAVPRVVDTGEIEPGGIIYLPESALSQSPEDLQCTIAHELGHTMGLDHPKNEKMCTGSIMKKAGVGCVCNGRVVTDDDRKAALDQTYQKTICEGPLTYRNDGGGVPDPAPGPTPTNCYIDSHTIETRNADYSNCAEACNPYSSPVRVNLVQENKTYCGVVLVKDEFVDLGWYCTCQ